MTLSVWTEYYDFFVITIGLVVGMILIYFIFFKPRRSHSQETIEYIEPVSNDLEDSSETNDDSPIDEEIESFDEASSKKVKFDEYIPNEFEMGENSNIFESIDNEENIFDEIPEGIEILHEDDEEVEEVELEEEVVEEAISKVKLFGKFDLRPEINAKQQIDEIIEDVLKISEQKPAQVGGKYHVLFEKDTKQWYVKREGETIKSKYLVTQGEAIAYATIKALENETTIVVHDKDGRISKYKF